MFNNREIATAIWLTLFAIWMLTKSNIRTSLAGVFRAVLAWKILVCLAAMVLYTITIVACFYALGFWQFTMIKDTTLWFCFTAFAMAMRFTTSGDDENIFRHVLVDNAKLIIVIEFLIATYVMPLPAELAFVPFVTILAMVDVVARVNKQYAPAAKLTGILLAVIGFSILGFAVSSAIGDYRNFRSMDTVRSIALPPLMSIAFVPFVYLLVVITTYESIFITLALGRDKAPKLVRYAKRRILFDCGLSLRRLRNLARRPPFEIMQIESNDDVDRVLLGRIKEN